MNNLKGKVIAITRPAERTAEAAEIVEKYGGIPFLAPTLELQISSSDSLIKLCKMAAELDWLIFTSPTAILSLFKHCKDLDEKLNPRCRIAVIGPRTANFLMEYGLEAEIIPEDYTAEGLLEVFKDIDIRNKKIGLPRTMIARDVLPEGLKERGAQVFVAEAYRSALPNDRKKVNELIKLIIDKKVAAVTFTSPLTVKNLFKMAKEEYKKEEYENQILGHLQNGEVLVAAIGPVTGKALEEYGITALTPEEYTVKEMLNRLADEIAIRNL